MIEKASALEEIDGICAVLGVDMVQFGSADWSMSLGWNRTEHPDECGEAERKMIESALRYGVRPRCEITSAAAAEYYEKLGVRDFCLNDDISCLRNFWFNTGAQLRTLADGND